MSNIDDETLKNLDAFAIKYDVVMVRNGKSVTVGMLIDAIFRQREEIARLRKALEHYISCVRTVREHNTSEWMEYIKEETNASAKAREETK